MLTAVIWKRRTQTEIHILKQSKPTFKWCHFCNYSGRM